MGWGLGWYTFAYIQTQDAEGIGKGHKDHPHAFSMGMSYCPRHACLSLSISVSIGCRTSSHLHSHVVKSLKFGTQFPARGRRGPVDPGVQLEGLSALEDRVYTIDALHTAPHHYIKVGRFRVRPRLVFVNQRLVGMQICKIKGRLIGRLAERYRSGARRPWLIVLAH